ncbi:MAG: hypothetical protein KF782_15705 [Labilithrix sp.]|nr:hypothetical protein [Labilithrix sp.]
MKHGRTLLALLSLVAVLVPAAASTARAQTCPNNAPVCVGTDGRVIIAPPAPTVHVDPNADARARAEAEARARAEAEARLRAQQAALQAEVDRVLAWKAYLSWQARAKAEVELAASARLSADARANAERSWDRWAGAPLPLLGPRPDRYVAFPRAELSPLTFCAAVFTGRDLPSYMGACLPFRFRFDRSWSVLVDASFLFERYRDTRFHTAGLHPALAYSFAHGRGELAGSHAFVRAGFDGQIPIDGRTATPDTYVGAHAGLGAHAQLGDVVGIGLELRGLYRGGTSGADHGAARARFGAEVRAHVLTLAW